MKVKTFILTFLMMMSSTFLFGQNVLPGGYNMTITSKIILDGVPQTNTDYLVYAMHDGTVLGQSSIMQEGPDEYITEALYYVSLEVDGNSGDVINFKLVADDKTYISSTKVTYEDNAMLGNLEVLYPIEFKSVAQIGNVVYPSLQEAIDAAANGDEVTLLKNNAENVTVVQAPNVAFTIDGAEKTMSGTITVNGKSQAYATAGLTIQNVNFDATNISKDASINLGDGKTTTRYTNGVTVENCDFTGDDQTKVAIKNYTGGCENLTVTGGTFTGLHSLMQVKGVDGLTINGVTVEESGRGISVGTSTNVAISNSTFDVNSYGVRADGEDAYTMTLTDNTISAELPVVVRNAKEVAYNLTIAGNNNNFTAKKQDNNPEGYQVVFTTDDDGTYLAPTTGQFLLSVPENFNVYPVYVAQVGNLKYTSVVTAINEAADGATVQLLPGTIEEYVYPWPESNHSKEKSITIIGAENFGTTLTAGMYLGYDDSQCRNHTIVVEGIAFEGKGLTVACQENVTIKNNKFNNITDTRAIAVIGKEIKATVENNKIDGVQIGIELRNMAVATMTGNEVKNTTHNSVQVTAANPDADVTITDNTFENWGEEGEGRAIRVSGGDNIVVNNNKMVNDNAPESYVKITKVTETETQTIDVDKNYWNGNNPLALFETDGTNDPVSYINGYYSDSDMNMSSYITLAPSVAKIGDVYYQSLQAAINDATEGQTVIVLENVELENTVTVAAGKVVTLDLNGKTVSGISNVASTTAVILNKGNLTVKTSVEGGKITTQALQPDTNWGGEGEPPYPTYANNTIRNEGTFTLVSGRIENMSPAGGATYAIDNYNGSTTNIDGGEVYCENNLAIRLFCGDNISLNIDGGKIQGTRALWIQLANSNSSVAPNVEVNISDGEIRATGENNGYIQALYSYSYGNDMKNVEINISGGTFYGDINLTGGNNKTNIETLNISGGTFNGNEYDINSYGADEKAVGAISITGGTFSKNYAEKYALDNGYVFVPNQDGKYVLDEFEGFEIPNLDRLIAFRNAVNAGNTFAGQTVTVTADINMESVENWTPIGTLSTPFNGTFDGGNKTISNLNVNGGAYVGLFGYADNATIKNVKINNANVKGTNCVGVIAGDVYSTSLIDNCHVSGSIKVEGQTNVGGIVGKYYTKVTNSSVIGDGVATSYVKGVHYAADYEGDNIGGIMGHGGENNTFTNNTVKNITISGTRKVGGIVGVTDQNTDVTNCLVENVNIETTATAEYASANAAIAGHASIVGSYTKLGTNNNGTVTNCVVKNVTFVNNNNVTMSAGPITGGAREGMIDPTGVTASGNLVYMSTITGNTTNMYLMKAVAKIDETNYYTLDEAIAAANNQTVTVLENVELRNTLTIEAGKTVTLDLNGKTISVAITEQLTQSFAAIKNKGTLTVKDSGTEGKISVSYGGSSFGYGIGLYTISNEGGVLNIESGIIENTTTVSGSMYDAIDNNSTLGETVLNISGGEVRCAQYIGIRQFANNTTNDNIVNVTGGKVYGGNTSIWMQNPNSNQNKATIAISGNANIEGRLLAGESEEFVFAVTGGTFTTDVTDFCAPGYVCKQNTDGTYGVFLGVAKIEGTGAIYGTLTAAITAAQSGNTIVLLADITENVTVNKNLTIDGANDEAEDGKFDYTGTMTANAGLTVTVQNIDFVGGGFDKSNKSTSGNYTIKNCTFEDDGDYAYAFRFKGASSVTIENCTVKNYLYSFLYITSGTNSVSVKNVTVEDCPSYAVYFASGVNTATIENLTVKNSNNGFVINNTANRALTLKNCKLENVTNAINHANGTNTITCTLLGNENDFGTSASSQYATIVLAEANAKLTAQEDLDVTTTVEGSTVKYEEGTTTPGFGTYYVIPANVELVRGETSVGKFATIQDAIDAAQTGDVVRVLNDVTYTWDNVILNSSNYAVLLNVSGKDITLDMNGKTISVNHQSTTDRIYAVVCIEDGAGLTFTGEGTIDVDVDDNAPKVAYMFWKRGSGSEAGHLTIENGTFHMDNSEDSMVYTNGSGIVKVNGGTFTLDKVGTRVNGFPHIFSTQGQNEKNITVNGGTFNADVLHQYYAFEVNSSVNNALVDNGNGTWTIVTDGAVAYVTERYTTFSPEYSNEVGYATLADAVAAAHEYNYVTEDGQTSTVTLLQDITLEEDITVNVGKEIILDLKGKDIYVVNDQVNFNINGKLTLNDETGEGVFTSRNHFVNEGAEFIVNGGTVQNVETATGGFPINLNGGSVTIKGGTVQAVNNDNYAIGGNGGTLVIEGGTVKGNWGAVNLASGNATITDGTLEVTGTTGGHALYVAGNTEVTIEGGEFKPYVGGGAASYALVLNSENATVNVSGGMFHKGWGCVIVYAGDLSLTGGTFGSNMVITNNSPLESADINTFCAEGYGAIANADETLWTVMPVQEQTLPSGWSWYSSYLNITLDALTTALGDNGVQIKNQEALFKQYDDTHGWYGSLTAIDLRDMYMVNVKADQTLKVAAPLAVTEEYTITIYPGWNWIGYPSNVNVDINTVLALLTPETNDLIKTQHKGYAQFNYNKWRGGLKTMLPGEGYMYYSNATTTKTFVYTVEATRGTVEANVTAENNYWTPDATKYPFNMTMTAVVDGLTDANYEVAAFVNGEVRGSARPIYIEEIDAYVLFLTIHGEDVEEMSFRLYDIDNDTEYDLSDRINYSNDAHLGSVNEPYVFSRGTTGIGEAAMSNVNIYPNPTTTGTEINLQATCDTVEVFNALGVKVAEYQNVDTIDALETAGIYVIRITNDGNVQNCRLVVK